MSGPQLAERVRALRPEVKVLYASGYPDELLRPHDVGEGAPDFLPKPFIPEQLAIKVREVLGSPRPWGRILVVDDEPGVRQVVRSLLENAGYAVAEAAHGGDAMAQVRAGGIDLVLTDLVMPEQEGVETIRALRLESPDMPIIAMSGAFGGDFLRIAGLVGAHATVSKPVDPTRLLGHVRAMLAR
jgi:CheY-like chemotaxis protein